MKIVIFFVVLMFSVVGFGNELSKQYSLECSSDTGIDGYEYMTIVNYGFFAGKKLNEHVRISTSFKVNYPEESKIYDFTIEGLALNLTGNSYELNKTANFRIHSKNTVTKKWQAEYIDSYDKSVMIKANKKLHNNLSDDSFSFNMLFAYKNKEIDIKYSCKRVEGDYLSDIAYYDKDLVRDHSVDIYKNDMDYFIIPEVELNDVEINGLISNSVNVLKRYDERFNENSIASEGPEGNFQFNSVLDINTGTTLKMVKWNDIDDASWTVFYVNNNLITPAYVMYDN